MLSAHTWMIGTCLLSLAACDARPAETKKDAERVPSEKVELVPPEKIEPVPPEKPEPAQPEKVEPAQPAPAEPLTFTFGARTFTAATALSSRFNDQRRVIISSLPMTCDELLALPEQFKKGNVSFIVTTAWKLGTHPLASAEILEADTRKVTNIFPQAGTIEIITAPEGVDERGKIELKVSAPEGGASGTIDVLLCE
jgi:hypothetical protein